MSAAHAKAIRDGIIAARRCRYGEPDDPHFHEKEALTLRHWAQTGLDDLARRAFERTEWRIRAKKIKAMDAEERKQAIQVFEQRHREFNEPPTIRKQRLLREAAAATRQEIATGGESGATPAANAARRRQPG